MILQNNFNRTDLTVSLLYGSMKTDTSFFVPDTPLFS